MSTEEKDIGNGSTVIPTVSNRAQHLLEPHLNYIISQGTVLGTNKYDAITNPQGVIPLGIAENKLMHTEMLQQIRSFTSTSEEVLNYTWSNGAPELKEIIATFLSKHIFNIANSSSTSLEQQKVIPQVKPSQLCILSGCTAILHALSFCLFDTNESLLIPTPYYPYFDLDFGNIGHVKTVEVNNNLVNHNKEVNGSSFPSDTTLSFTLSIESLQAAYDLSITVHGLKPKALLLTNPNNPLGTIYSKEQLILALQWCRSHHMHFICDEIYALSVFDTASNSELANDSSSNANGKSENICATFQSIVNITNNELNNDIHVIWGLSKDFGASGLRLGVFYSHNEMLLTAMGRLSDAFQVSRFTQEFTCQLLHTNNDDFLQHFIAQNKIRLYQSYTILLNGLKAIHIPVIPSAGGIFLMADFRSCLKTPTFQAEDEFREFLIQSVGVIFTPGEACHSQIPGFFRRCYAWVSVETLQVALDRLAVHVPKLQDQCVPSVCN